MKWHLLWLVALLAIGLTGCDKASEQIHLQGKTMGTYWSVKIIANPVEQTVDATALQALIQSALDQVNSDMSNWNAESDISRFNAMQTGCVAVSQHTQKVMKASRRVYQQSYGAFDPSIEPLIKLWGFSTDVAPTLIPSQQARQDKLALIGFKKAQLSFSNEQPQLCKSEAVYLNLSAIAKGYAVDLVAKTLIDYRQQRFLVDVGGELVGKGLNAHNEPWQIGIESPKVLQQAISDSVSLSGLAIATSGDYRNYYEIGDERFSHLISPLTGFPVTHNAASVSVLHESAMFADAWATALLVAGPEQGLKMAEEHGIAVNMLMHSKDRLTAISSSQWQLLTEQ